MVTCHHYWDRIKIPEIVPKENIYFAHRSGREETESNGEAEGPNNILKMKIASFIEAVLNLLNSHSGIGGQKSLQFSVKACELDQKFFEGKV
ncbi:unnamed protein product [Rhizophagus irregularis]|nr:unnamed protein product [Rhizophagus irregularis]